MKKHKKIILGVTGSFGSGKTTVASVFKLFGARVIDADEISHRLLKGNLRIRSKIGVVFGKNVFGLGRGINRKKLADRVFNDEKLLIKLERILHPEIIREIKNEMKKSREKIVVLDAPLLIEAGLAGLVDKLIVVKICHKKQIQRLKKKFGFSQEEVFKRLKFQLPLQEKIRLADFIIDNGGRITQTKKQVKEIYKEISSAA